MSKISNDNKINNNLEIGHLGIRHLLGQLGIRSIRNYRDKDKKQGKVWLSSPLSFQEKLEFLYLSPYYLQAFFFLVGTFCWLIAETVFKARLPFWTALWGWSLVLTNFLGLPLLNAVGLFLEEAEEKDYSGLASFVILSYILVPFQAYASVKGFLEKEEGPWFRTPKTGKITDILKRGKFYRWVSGILPQRGLPFPSFSFGLKPSGLALDYLQDINTSNNPFNSFKITKRHYRGLVVTVLIFLIIGSSTIFSLLPTVPQNKIPYAQAQGEVGIFSTSSGNIVDKENISSSNAPLNIENGQEITKAALLEQKNTGGSEKLSEEKKVNSIAGTYSPNLEIKKVENEDSIYEANNLGSKVFFKETAQGKPVTRLEFRDFQFLEFEFVGFSKETNKNNEKQIAKRETDKNKIKWVGKENLFEIRQEVQAEKIKENIVLNRRPVGNQIFFEMAVKDLSWEDKEGNIIFSDPRSLEEIFRIPLPTVKDANGIEGEINMSINGTEMTLGINEDFLENASYPVEVDPTVITASSDDYPLGYAGQRKVFYANSYYWIFYSDGTNIVYQTSSDGITWSGTTTVAAGTDGRVFASWIDGTTVYYVREDGAYDIVANRGTISGSSISWGDSETTVFNGSGASDDYASYCVNITKDSDNKLWAVTCYYDGANRSVVAKQSSSADDTTSWGDASTVYTNTWALSGLTIAPLTSGQVYVVWYRGPSGSSAYYEGKLYNGSSWDADATSIGPAKGWTAAVDTTTSLVFDGSKLHLLYSDEALIQGKRLAYKNLVSPYASGNWSEKVGIGEDSAYDHLGYSLSYNTTDKSIIEFGPHYSSCGGSPRYGGYRRYDNGWLTYYSANWPTRIDFVRHRSFERTFNEAFTYDATPATYVDESADVMDCGGNDIAHTTSGRLIDANTDDYFYVGLTEPFETIYFDLGTVAAGGTPVLSVEYSQGSGSWGEITNASHGMVDNTAGLTVNTRDIRWTTNPNDWLPDSVNSSANYYWVRLHYSTAPSTTAPIGDEISPIREAKSYTSNYSDSSRFFSAFVDYRPSSSNYNINFFAIMPLSHTERLSASLYTDPVSFSFQRKTFYDGTNYFAFFRANALGYYDDNIFYKASSDGSTWNDPPIQTISSPEPDGTGGFSVWNNGSTVYLVYYGNTYDIIARQGTISGTTITWDTTTTSGVCSSGVCTVFDGTSTSNRFFQPYITRDSDGRLWAVARYYDGTHYELRARESSNADDLTAWADAATLGDANDHGLFSNGNIAGAIYPLASGKMYAIWYAGGANRGELYDGASWDATSLLTLGTASVTNNAAAFTPTAVVDSGTIHAVYSDSSGYLQHKSCVSPYASGNWSAATEVESGAVNSRYLSLSLNTDDSTLTLFYARQWATNSFKAAFKRYVSSSWAANPTYIAKTWETAFDAVYVYDASGTSYEDETSDASDTSTADIAHSTSGDMIEARGDYLYVGLDEKFDGVFFSLSTAANAGGGMTVEYSAGSSSWKKLPFNDGTKNASGLDETGNLVNTDYPVIFDPPTDWTTDSVNSSSNYYWVRFGWVVAPTTAPIGTTVAPVMQDEALSSNYSAAGKSFAIWQQNDFLVSSASMYGYRINFYKLTAAEIPENLIVIILVTPLIYYIVRRKKYRIGKLVY